MIDQDLEIVKIALAVVAPWSRENFFNVGVIALLFCHFGNDHDTLGNVLESGACEKVESWR